MCASDRRHRAREAALREWNTVTGSAIEVMTADAVAVQIRIRLYVLSALLEALVDIDTHYGGRPTAPPRTPSTVRECFLAMAATGVAWSRGARERGWLLEPSNGRRAHAHPH
ncbi:hypothetical protein LLS1_31480 [Leifsonia sp. LS1]|nr:hypothetical protein LLS1_31480 [Leifsonia sp. LS1]